MTIKRLLQDDGHKLRVRACPGRTFTWPSEVGGGRVKVAPQAPVLVVDHGKALAAAAPAGRALAAVANHIVSPFMRDGRLVPALSDLATEHAPVSVAFSESRRRSPTVRTFLDRLAGVVPPSLAWDIAVLG